MEPSEVRDGILTAAARNRYLTGQWDFPAPVITIFIQKGREIFFPWHWHEEFEINYVKKGSIKPADTE